MSRLILYQEGEPEININITKPETEKEKIIVEVLDLVNTYMDAKKNSIGIVDSKLNHIQEMSLYYIALKFVMCMGGEYLFHKKLLAFIKYQYLLVEDTDYLLESYKSIDYYTNKYNECLENINTNTYMEDELEQKFEELDDYRNKIFHHNSRCFRSFYRRVRYLANLHLTNLLRHYPEIDVPESTLSRYKHMEDFRYLYSVYMDTMYAYIDVMDELDKRNDIDKNLKNAILKSQRDQRDTIRERLFGNLTEITYDNDINHFLR